MESYKKYQTAKHSAKECTEWMANKSKTDSQDHSLYALRGITFSAEYCGQAYAGATNYHKAPTAFNAAMVEVIKERFAELSEAAPIKVKALESKALIACKDDLLAVQAEIAEAEQAA